ncbi:ornithine cyclodeaminase [Sphaerisporangium krabiense]|uniref:Ornithine cyclodeaminase n=1 Tax=Sphaerisporangium krabiense TaxID=763782 RepID=A0A7W9DTV3_9ACTN|nr:ornithine cyclodeaminase family protein [Sphaerisporangium krabiense]MBB5631013.1 ornithine cyclodeaminase [Sphaerisporangium krabiense]GII65895.1 ornithine cyclodeaminase [Sphaerisporangium krabiense]
MTAPAVIGAEHVRALVPMEAAVTALADALRGGLDPGADPPRPVVEVPAGQLLLMPAAHGRHAGVKIAGVAPANPARGLPRIQGAYLLLDGATLATLAVIDGPALTALRTPAVSALAVRRLARPDARTLTVFGAGPQAWGHVEALRAVRPVERVTVVGRDRGRAEALAARCAAAGLHAAAVPAARRAEVERAVASADLIACCTSAREPLFPGALVAGGATVVAVGSHEPEAREVDGALVARATVVVETRAVALAEAGDVILPLREGVIGADHLVADLRELERGTLTPGPGPRLFKSVGMAWEDLVVAAAVHDAWRSGSGGDAKMASGPERSGP